MTSAAGVCSITYDYRGNTVGETRPGRVSVTASYDGFGGITDYARMGELAQAN